MTSLYEAKSWYLSVKAQKTLEALRKNGFQTVFAHTKQEALEKALAIIPPDAKVGIGGSVTIREIGLAEALVERGNAVVQHWEKEPGLDAKTVMRMELSSDIFLASSNAITEDGKLINIDGTGNRVGAMVFGPEKVLIIAGINKIVRDVGEGIRRVKNVAAPMNAKRLNKKTPCVRTGVCTECDAPDRICRITTIMERKPTRTEVIVMLVGEELGF